MQVHSNDTVSTGTTNSNTGLLSRANWINFLRGKASGSTYEYPFYSDAHITGEVTSGVGPYAFLNTVPRLNMPGDLAASIVLRVADHLGEYQPDMTKTDESLYHGGSLIDELAALTSLCLGVRIHAGGETRRFEPNRDPLGRPFVWNDHPKPVVRTNRNRLLLPSLLGTHSLMDLEPLKSIPTIEPTRYVNLIRAARSYKDALWVAESDPNLAWLLLVSALETGANDVIASASSPEEKLRIAQPELASMLDKAGGADLTRQIAKKIAHLFGATKKFLEFTLQFLPSEPTVRGQYEWLRLDWTKTRLSEVLKKIYEYRSRSLHGGIPFPAPMLEPPFYFGEGTEPSEVPMTGSASHSHGATWLPDDAPINLHSFHYIVRGALLSWWKTLSVLPNDDRSEGTDSCSGAAPTSTT